MTLHPAPRARLRNAVVSGTYTRSYTVSLPGERVAGKRILPGLWRHSDSRGLDDQVVETAHLPDARLVEGRRLDPELTRKLLCPFDGPVQDQDARPVRHKGVNNCARAASGSNHRGAQALGESAPECLTERGKKPGGVGVCPLPLSVGSPARGVACSHGPDGLVPCVRGPK